MQIWKSLSFFLIIRESVHDQTRPEKELIYILMPAEHPCFFVQSI